jgi:ribosomal protein L24
MHIKTNDTVEVITGDDKGQRGKVLKINRTCGRLVVEGVNRVYKHVRRSQKNPQGGRLSKEMPVQVSNDWRTDVKERHQRALLQKVRRRPRRDRPFQTEIIKRKQSQGRPWLANKK